MQFYKFLFWTFTNQKKNITLKRHLTMPCVLYIVSSKKIEERLITVYQININ